MLSCEISLSPQILYLVFPAAAIYSASLARDLLGTKTLHCFPYSCSTTIFDPANTMSLMVDGDRRRDRSRSRSRDPRPRDDDDFEPVRPFYPESRESSYAYPEDDDYARKPKSSRRRQKESGLPYPNEEGMNSMLPGSENLYRYKDDRRSEYRTQSPNPGSDRRIPGGYPNDRDDRNRRDDIDDEMRSSRKDRRSSKYDKMNQYSEHEQGLVRYEDPSERHARRDDEDKLQFLPQKYSKSYDNGRSDSKRYKQRDRYDNDDDDLAYGRASPLPPGGDSPPTYGSYIPSSKHDDRRHPDRSYDDEDDSRRSHTGSHRDSHYEDSRYRDARQHDAESRETSKYDKDRDDHRRDTRRHNEPKAKERRKASALTAESSGKSRDRSRDRRRDASPSPNALAVGAPRERERSRDRRGSARDKSPLPTSRMSSLTVDTARPVSMSLAAAPGSPLLESYRGTYQDCSPMPSPLLLASQSHNADIQILDALSPANSDLEGDGKKRSRRARFHDPEDIASRLAAALRGTKAPDTGPLINILPSLSHEQVMELRVEYKQLVKTGSERKGVNIAKHIRARLKDDDPLLMKACYSVALGTWESEAYWANFWYQGDKTRRELLIETLMGRTNDEIRKIKDGFTDKKYDNSLVKCMKTELKEDKFKKAVLLVLDERRMDEFDHHGRRLPIDYKLVDNDVEELRHAVKSEKGGESMMISIIIQRSDSHLRAILKEYEHHYRANFARESLKKSGNLVVSFAW